MKTFEQRSVSSEKNLPPTYYTGAIMSRISQMFGVLAVAVSMVCSYTPALAVVIDPFDVDQVESDGTGGGDSGTAASLGIIGGKRGVYVGKTSGPASASFVIKAVDDGTGGTFSVSRDSGTGGHALVQWDGDDTAPTAFDPTSNLSFLLDDGAGAAGYDLTAGGTLGILVKVLVADVAGQTLEFKLFSDDATEVSTQSYALVGTAPPTIDVLFPWAGFAGTADLAGVKAITLAITGPVGSDLTIDLLGTYVPEPATAGIFGLGAIAILGRLRRSRSRRQS